MIKIVRSQSSVHYSVSVDGKDIHDMSSAEQSVLLDKLIKEYIARLKMLDKEIAIDQILDDLDYDDYESNEKSHEQCGDTVTITTWDIDDE